MSEELETVLNLVGANYPGCHNCKFHNPDIPWDCRSSECKVCTPSNWIPNETTKMSLELLKP